jgi:tetratricopeptide (TPR) repeat protein
MKSKSKLWSRAVTVLVAGMLVTTKACAESPWSPRVLLDKGDEGVLTAPEALFDDELRRIKVSAPQFRTNDMPTTQAELNDLRAALRKLRTPKLEVEKIVAAHAAQRVSLAAGTNQVEVVEGLPPEFADYFRGSMAMRQGDPASAIREWETLLKRPPAERHFKSVWAAYMLGRMCQEEEPERAIEYFQQVRSLAAAGFADGTGLAAASLGWEARAHLCQRRLTRTIELYLEQAAGGSYSANMSLSQVAGDALGQPELLPELAAHPQARRVITACANSERQDAAHWLEVVENQEGLDADEAEALALVALRSGNYDAAEAWIKRAGSTPITQWLQAKVYVRAGKLKQALALLGKASAALPFDPQSETNRPPHETLAQNIFIRGRRYYYRISPGQHILAEMGVLHVALRDYVAALDCFLRARFWMDAAYVAERVLTVEELKGYVDAHWPEVSTEDSDDVVRRPVRALLGRRLVRASLPARDYFPPSLQSTYDELMAALKRGETESLSAEERSAGWWEGAKMLHNQGRELIGTELEPDWRMGWPYYAVTVWCRATNDNARVLTASPDELQRARSHHPDPDEREHYRYQAAFIALQAASLLPDHSEQKARILCSAGSWIKYMHPQTADIFYKHLVRRCRKTALGAAADTKRWFPAVDGNGDLLPMAPIIDEPDATESVPPELPTVILVE